jgi:hypothetical protein
VKAFVSLSVHGNTLDEMETEVIRKLADLSGTDTIWDLRYDVSPWMVNGVGQINLWQAEVSGWTATGPRRDISMDGS